MSKTNDKDILKEAILDAQKVRDAAMENAKAVVEEAFRPRLQSLISAKIREEAGEEEETDEFEEETEEVPTEEVPTEETPVEAPVEVPTEEPPMEAPVEDDEEINIDFEDDEQPEQIDFNLEDDEEKDEEELNIETIIKELEDEMEDDDVEDDYQSLIDEIDDEDLELDIEDDFIDEDVEIEIEDEDDDEEIEESSNVQYEALSTEFNTLKEQHGQAMKVVKYLKDKLNEINLVNSKLLYSNKLFKAYSLDNSSKMKIIESLDRAKNSREAKLIYVTLTESIATGAARKQSPKMVENITKGMPASKSIPSTKPSKKIINEQSETMKERFQTLAGILNG